MNNIDQTKPQDLRSTSLSNGNRGSIIRIAADGNCLFRAVVEGYKHLGRGVPNYIADHIALRARVIEELRKPANRPLIAMNLSAEREVEVNSITDADIESYIKNMATLRTWGSMLEITTIASILQIRILVHQNGHTIKIPQEADYDTWLELIELVHEPVNAGLVQADDKGRSNNHYNLAVERDIAMRIINDSLEEIKTRGMKRNREGSLHLSV